MERKIYNDLLEWKQSPDRKPLILQGARQVGKTYIVNYFAGKEYANSVYCNFEKDTGLHSFFSDLSPSSIIKKLSIYKRREIVPGNTLIIFDEIQACPEAITSLKYFNEEANGSHIIALGSLLGVSVNRGNFSFPVGKVQFMTLYPLDFEEYLMARGEDGLIELIRECYTDNKPLDNAFHERALDYYKEYLFVGGMPEAVEEFGKNHNTELVRIIQQTALPIQPVNQTRIKVFVTLNSVCSIDSPYRAATLLSVFGPVTVNPSVAGLGKPNSSMIKPTSDKNGLKSANAQITPHTLNIVCDIAARLACVLPTDAAILAVIVVPIFSPSTIAHAMWKGIQPILSMMSVIAIVADDDCSTKVRIVPKTRKMSTDPKPWLAQVFTNSNTCGVSLRSGTDSFINESPRKRRQNPTISSPMFWR